MYFLLWYLDKVQYEHNSSLKNWTNDLHNVQIK